MNDATGNLFKLTQGSSAETSGGLLLCLPADRAEAFVRELQETDGHAAWVVGRVVPGARDARIVEDAAVVEV
ncbi:MAG: AIR synthase-related protein [Allorhizobium sp.]